MFGGDGTYEVKAFDAGNTSNEGNLKALFKLINLGYVIKGTYERYFTTEKFTPATLDILSKTFTRISLDGGISLQKIESDSSSMRIEVNQEENEEVNGEVKGRTGTLIGQVMLTRNYSYVNT